MSWRLVLTLGLLLSSLSSGVLQLNTITNVCSREERPIDGAKIVLSPQDKFVFLPLQNGKEKKNFNTSICCMSEVNFSRYKREGGSEGERERERERREGGKEGGRERGPLYLLRAA